MPTEHRPTASERMSPYPAMVTVGVDEDGGAWFIDLEAAGVVQIVGERAEGEDLARFIAAELALNPWSDFEAVDVVGVAEDVVPIHGRLLAASKLDVEEVAKSVRRTTEHLESAGRSVLASRVNNWRDALAPTLYLTLVEEQAFETMRTQTAALLGEMERAPGRTAIALVTVSSAIVDQRATTLAFTAAGELQTPWGLVRPNRLPADVAAVLEQLFDDAETEGDVDIPAAVDHGGEPLGTDQAGALAEHLTEARCGTGDPGSVLPRPDRTYIEAAATTVEDLAVLAPAVPSSDAAAAIAADPLCTHASANFGSGWGRSPEQRNGTCRSRTESAASRSASSRRC